MANLPNVVILGDFEHALRRYSDWSKIDQLCKLTIYNSPIEGEALYEAVKEADIVILVRDRTPFDGALISRLPKLKLLMFTGKRNSTLDVASLKARGIPIACTPGGPSKDSTAELTWALILGASKNLLRQNALIQSGGWRDELSVLPMLSGERLGLIGLGAIGTAVAKVGIAFGMEVVTWSPNMTAERANAQNVKSVSLDELLQSSKVVSLHLVAGASTKGLIGSKQLALMRPDALLVNTARSALINMDDSQAALNLGRPAQAALDVFEMEPIPKEDSLRNNPALLLTPHLGFVAEPIFKVFSNGITETLEAWFTQKNIPHPFED